MDSFPPWTSFVLSFLFILSAAVPAHAATFPITQNFSGSQPSDWELRGSASWNTTVSGDATLRLTPATASQSGLGFYDDAFSSDLGIVAEFRYYAGGGNGADGLTFFLVDGDQVDESNIASGASGAALGYAQSDAPANGIPHAYLGVGFDEFGNFVTNTGGMDQGSHTAVPDSVVLRGSGNGTTGYEYLTHRDVYGDFGQRIDGGWRIARVTVIPGSDDATIRVEMSWNEGATWYTIIDDYVYNEAPPSNLKLGFTAGTGGSTNIHAIGNLEVNLPVDLETEVTDAPSGTYERGDEFTYTYTVTNHGPNDSASTTISNTIPIGALGIDDLTWELTSTEERSASGTGVSVNAIHTEIDAGETITITVSGTVGADILNTTDLDHTITAVPGAGEKDPSPGDAKVTVEVETDAPTAAEAALMKILAYAQSNGTTTEPTVSDYATAGVTGVTADTLDDLNEMVAESGATDLEDIQALADESVIPHVVTLGATDITVEGGWLHGELVRLGDIDVLSFGFEFGLTAEYGNYLWTYINDTGEYTLEMREFTCNTVYHYRAFVEDVPGDRWYGEDKTFTTRKCPSINTTTYSSRAPAKTVVPTASDTVEQRVAALKAQLAVLQAQLQELLQKNGNAGSEQIVTSLDVRDLYLDMEGEDVRKLQEILIKENIGPAAKELMRVGITGFFSNYTKNALGEYQKAKGILPYEGYFGKITRDHMKSAGVAGLWW